MTRRRNKKVHLTAIDVFAGGGGLTVGLKRAGFNVVGAVEVENHAFATYKANHPDVMAFKQDVRTITGKSFLKLSPSGEIHLLSGCPPCQGFTSLTFKYKRKDPRNDLITEMYRLAKEVRPKALMMENVPGLANRGKKLFAEFVKGIEGLGYRVNADVFQVADFGVPQFRRRLVLLAGLGFEISFPNPTHSRTGQNGLPKWKTIKEVIAKMPEPITLAEIKKRGLLNVTDWHVVRTLSPQNHIRLKLAKPGKSWSQIPEKYRPDCHKGSYRGFSNVYGRMSWDAVSPTITGGCTTLSKGRFGHPERERTISVREAALLQTFPSDYYFDSPYMDHVCNIIGNALPCDFAEAMARQCFKSLKNSGAMKLNH